MFGTYERLNVHIDATAKEVIRAAAKKLTHAARRGRAHREERHIFYRKMLEHHAASQEIAAQFRL